LGREVGEREIVGWTHPQTPLHVISQIRVFDASLAALEAKAAKVIAVQQIGHRPEVWVVAEIIQISGVAATRPSPHGRQLGAQTLRPLKPCTQMFEILS
jgi:hypothetical protein